MHLGWDEVQIVALVGANRRLKAKQRRRWEPNGSPEAEPWWNDIDAAGAELVVAKTVNQHWNFECLDSLAEKPPDVGKNIEVRWTIHPHGHLYVFDRDPVDRWYFLVIGSLPDYEIAGCISGARAKARELQPTPRGNLAYIVGQDELT